VLLCGCHCYRHDYGRLLRQAAGALTTPPAPHLAFAAFLRAALVWFGIPHFAWRTGRIRATWAGGAPAFRARMVDISPPTPPRLRSLAGDALAVGDMQLAASLNKLRGDTKTLSAARCGWTTGLRLNAEQPAKTYGHGHSFAQRGEGCADAVTPRVLLQGKRASHRLHLCPHIVNGTVDVSACYDRGCDVSACSGAARLLVRRLPLCCLPTTLPPDLALALLCHILDNDSAALPTPARQTLRGFPAAFERLTPRTRGAHHHPAALARAVRCHSAVTLDPYPPARRYSEVLPHLTLATVQILASVTLVPCDMVRVCSP